MTAPDPPADSLLEAAARLAAADPLVCTSDPEFEPGRLEAWKAGAEDALVVAHLGDCAACRAFVAALAPLSPALVDRIAGPKPRRKPLIWLAFPALAAAAVLVVALWPGGKLPAYTGAPPSGGVQTLKAAAQASTTFGPTSRLRWVVRPATRVEPPPSARAEVLVGGARVPLPAGAVRVEPGGAVVVEGPAGALMGGPDGPRRLIVTISPAGGGRDVVVEVDLTYRGAGEGDGE